VSQLWKKVTFAALAMLMALAPSASLVAQQPKPVVVVSLAPVEKQLQDLNYLADLVGQKEKAQGVLGFVPVFLNGIDMKRPSGAYLVPAEGGEFQVVAFVPVTKLETVFKTFEEQIGKPKDAGNGVLELDAPGGQSVFIKEQKGWAFVSNDSSSLTQLPADPLALLGTLPTLYNVAVRANVHEIPAELRQTAVDAIQSGLDKGLEENAGNQADRELAEKVGRMSAKQFTRLIEEVDQLTIGWGVDRAAKSTYVDFEITAVEGTSMARQMALLQDTTSKFAGFLMPGASVTADGSTKMSPEDIEQNVALFEVFRARAEKEIDNDAGLEANQRAEAKDLLKQFFSVLTDTIKGGNIDYGATLMLEKEELDFAAGTLVADGKKLEAAFAKLVKLAENEPDFPEVKLNAGKHGDVNLHTIVVEIPADEEEAQKLFGEKLNIVVGTAPKALYVAFGKNGEALLKKAIDASATQASKKVPPSQMNVYVKPIVRFASSMDESENPILAHVVDALDNIANGTDEINLFTKPIPGGAIGRLQVNEGVLKIVGEALKAAQGDNGQ
jgi:hypothetical protein